MPRQSFPGAVPLEATEEEKTEGSRLGEAVEVLTVMIKFLADPAGVPVSDKTDRKKVTVSGHRGTVLAAHKESKQMILIAVTSGANVRFGKLYMVKEFSSSEHPYVVDFDVHDVPAGSGWTVIA